MNWGQVKLIWPNYSPILGQSSVILNLWCATWHHCYSVGLNTVMWNSGTEFSQRTHITHHNLRPQQQGTWCRPLTCVVYLIPSGWEMSDRLVETSPLSAPSRRKINSVRGSCSDLTLLPLISWPPIILHFCFNYFLFTLTLTSFWYREWGENRISYLWIKWSGIDIRRVCEVTVGSGGLPVDLFRHLKKISENSWFSKSCQK